jgi:Domain of unknown function (4846)
MINKFRNPVFLISVFILMSGVSYPVYGVKTKPNYKWKRRFKGYEALLKRYKTPKGFKRVKLKTGTYKHWLRNLPMLPKKTPLKDYKGNVIADYNYYVSGLIDLDVGKKNLQHCIDVIIRLRGEYLWRTKQKNKIKFLYKTNRYFSWSKYSAGKRPKKVKGRYKLLKSTYVSHSYKNFKRYMRYLFAYTGTMHHIYEKKVKPANIKVGDFFIYQKRKGLESGHAILVLDIVKNTKGEKMILTGQSDMPAQDFHVIKNRKGSPWFKLPKADFKGEFFWPTPFKWSNLRRFKN